MRMFVARTKSRSTLWPCGVWISRVWFDRFDERHANELRRGDLTRFLGLWPMTFAIRKARFREHRKGFAIPSRFAWRPEAKKKGESKTLTRLSTQLIDTARKSNFAAFI